MTTKTKKGYSTEEVKRIYDKWKAQEKKTNTPNLRDWFFHVGIPNCNHQIMTLEMLIKWTSNSEPLVQCSFCGDIKPYRKNDLVCRGCREYKGILPYIPEWSDWG